MGLRQGMTSGHVSMEAANAVFMSLLGAAFLGSLLAVSTA
jgi:hypothetical protein